MNEQQRVELEQLKRQQQRLLAEVQGLSAQLAALEGQMQRSSAPASSASPIPLKPEPLSPAAPQVARTAPAPIVSAPKPEVRLVRPEVIPVPPPPIPPVLPAATLAQGSESPAAPAGGAIRIAMAAQPATGSLSVPVPPRITRPASVPTAPAAQSESSLEMRLGTYWLVRVGIVLVLTGLVFFGNLAYHNYISKLGAGGKISLLYVASFALLGAGAWWQRQAAKESLKNYAQVLFAGGLAAVYFTTYAAHHIAQVRVIQSPLLDGTLLLGWAGFMAWIADRKRSEVLALFAVGLAYYTSIITRVGSFTLYSNLILTAAAVFFLVKNRWAALTLGSLFATYAAYGFWRFFDGSNWHWASPEAGLWSGTYFLICYWLLFTAATFLSRDERFANAQRTAFATLNNGAFFTLFVLTMMQVQQGGFWKFALIYGSALLALTPLARRMFPQEPLVKNGYLSQGLLLVTVGIISNPHLAGLQLALILAVESVTLLYLGQLRKNQVMAGAAYAAAFLALGWGIDGMHWMDRSGLWLAIGLGLLMMVNTFLTHRQGAAAAGSVMRPGPACFTLLALVVWLVATWNNVEHQHFPLFLAVEALVLTASIYWLCVPEVSLLAQGYLILAQSGWVLNSLESGKPVAWWSPALILAITVGLSHWWQRQKTLTIPRSWTQCWQALYALAAVGVLYFWLERRFSAPGWLVMTSLLAVGLTLYGTLTRSWWIAAFGQVFMVVSAAQFAWQLFGNKPSWSMALAPMAALGLLSLAVRHWLAARLETDARIGEPVQQLAVFYRWLALPMSIWWVWEYIPLRERIWFLALLGLFVFLLAGLQRSREALAYGAVYTAAALYLFWLPLVNEPTVYWPNLAVILILLGQRQFARRLPERYVLEPTVHSVVILIGGLSIWLFLSRWVLESASGFYLTACWSLLALAFFGVGVLLRERIYRWLGLGVLACALGRVVIFDIWKLEALYRVLSLMALGVVLLVLGFVYSRFQEKIREWL